MNKTPIYQHSGVYAREHDELKKYLASHNAHLACKKAIEQAIANHYQRQLSVDQEEINRAVTKHDLGAPETGPVRAATIIEHIHNVEEILNRYIEGVAITQYSKIATRLQIDERM